MTDLHKLVAEKFTSGNEIEVERITITREEYEAALAQPEPFGLVCPTCNADRTKEACKGDLSNCWLKGQAHSAQPEQDPCSTDVFKHGVSMGLFDMSKEDAEKYCQNETIRTGHKHDWHYYGGRVHVKSLPVAPQELARTEPGVIVD